MKFILAIVIMVTLSGCGVSGNSPASTRTASDARAGHARGVLPLTEDEKQRLYTAALIATGSQLQTELFQAVCQQIGIMNADGIPNENYTRFVSEDRWRWIKKPEAEQFRQAINTKEKAQAYLKQHMRQ